MSIEYLVQYHTTRAELVQRLTAKIPQARLITNDETPFNPWSGYKRCLESISAIDGHVCILQDDVIVGNNFTLALEQVAAANPDNVVSLFLSKQPRRTFNMASLRYGKSRYVDNHLQDLVHVVGLLWPVEKARSFLGWVDENPKRARGQAFQSDDATVTRWMQLTKQRIRVTVPSLVEHPDDVPSIVNKHRAKAGADSGRVAAYWIGDADPLELDWSR